MADGAKVKRICDELGVSREEALYYLEGLDWNLVAAIETCRIKLLPVVKFKSSPRGSLTSPRVSLNEKSTPAESSSTIVPVNSPRISSQCPREELPPELKKELIDRFREVAPVVSPQEAVNFLNRFNWDVQRAVNFFMDLRDSQNMSDSDSYSDSDDEDDRPTIDRSYLHRFREDRIPMIGQSHLEGFSRDETSAALAMEMIEQKGPLLPLLPSQSQFEASICSSSGLIDVDVAQTGDLRKKSDEAIPVMALSQVQIQESSSPAQIKEEELLAPIKVDRICRTIKVRREEALYYLEGFNWDLASAMEACRNKTLPPVKVKSSPGVSVNEEPASPEWESPPSSPEWESPPSPPVVINSRRVSNKIRILPEQLPPKQVQLPPPALQAELINSFCNVTGASPGDALDCLNHFKWSGDDAVGYFMDKRVGNLNSQRISEGDHSTTKFSEDVASKALASERKALIKSFCDVTGASPEDAVDCLTHCKWNGNDAIGYFMDGNLNSRRISEGDRSMTGFSEGVTSKALASEIPLMGLPSQSQLQAPLGSSSSLMNIDPTETEKSLKEASGESVNVAITPMRSSQVDNKLKGKAVEEDSSTETFPNMITIDITFPDNTKVNIPFRSDQTVRDIRDAIDALRPDASKDYYFMSRTCEDYKDLNTTVGEISTRENTSLMQVYPD